MITLVTKELKVYNTIIYINILYKNSLFISIKNRRFQLLTFSENLPILHQHIWPECFMNKSVANLMFTHQECKKNLYPELKNLLEIVKVFVKYLLYHYCIFIISLLIEIYYPITVLSKMNI